MSENTKIEWAHHTFNPWIGCTKVGPGCDNCYAEADFDKRRHVVTWGAGQPRKRTSAAYWRQPIKWNKDAARLGVRYRVFCASLADVFDNAVDESWRLDLFWLIRQTPHLDWLLLTKRIGNASSMIREAIVQLDPAGEWPVPLPNVWLGATVVNQEEADRDIPKLLAVPAAIRFLSMEPLLGPVDLAPAYLACRNAENITMDPETGGHECCQSCDYTGIGDDIGIDWVIVGGESGPKARPMHPEWARGLRDECAAAGVPFLFKQWGEWAPRSGAITGGETNFVELDPGCNRWPRVTRLGEHGLDTRISEHCTPDAGQDIYMQRVGKQLAGRLLDGVQHDGYPRSGGCQ